MSWLVIKSNTYYIHNFLKAIANKIRESVPFNAGVITCVWYFNNNIFSAITPLAFDNDSVFFIQIFRLHSLAFFFFLAISFICVEIKCGFFLQNFYWESTTCLKQSNSWVRNGSFSKMLTSKNSRVSFFFLSYVILYSSNLIITRNANLEQLYLTNFRQY